jgi:glycerol-3-phosphate dehydrogenase (NAD(P)+)
VEYVSILKNIIGIATGIATGLYYGDNFMSVLVSNAMRETSHFLQTVDHRRRDLYDSAYFGDLLVTAYSEHSRNRTLGKLIGRGIHVSKALQAMEMIAEGFHASAEFAPLLNNSTVKMPIVTAVYRVLHQHANPFHEFKLLEEHLS